jgi:hypothetical protein
MTEAMALPFDDAVLILDARSVAMCGMLAMCTNQFSSPSSLEQHECIWSTKKRWVQQMTT